MEDCPKERKFLQSAFLSALFFSVACLFTGGVSGIMTGFAVIEEGHVGWLSAYVYGMPLGAVIGLMLALFMVRRLAISRRFWVGGCILFFGLGMALSMYVLVW